MRTRGEAETELLDIYVFSFPNFPLSPQTSLCLSEAVFLESWWHPRRESEKRRKRRRVGLTDWQPTHSHKSVAGRRKREEKENFFEGKWLFKVFSFFLWIGWDPLSSQTHICKGWENVTEWIIIPFPAMFALEKKWRGFLKGKYPGGESKSKMFFGGRLGSFSLSSR